MTSKVRILQLVTTTIGGAGEHVLLLSKGLDKSQFEVTVAFSPGMPLDQAFYDAGLRVIPIPMRRSGGMVTSLKGFASLLALIRRERFDIVHTHTSVAGALGRVGAKLVGGPIVIHMVHAYAAHDYVPSLKRWIFLQIERFLDTITDYYVAGSEAIRTKGIERRIMSPNRIRCIYYALDLVRFDAYASTDERKLREELGILGDDAIIGVIGRLEQQKGIECFLDAAARITHKRAAVRFLIVGDGPLRAFLEHKTRSLGLGKKVHFLGWRKDIPRVMKALDVLVVPSLWEAFGIVNLEAMAARKPVVATSVEGIPEVVENGVTGLLVPPCDARAISEAVSKILDDPELQRRMGESGRHRVETMFTAEAMVKEHQELYWQLLSERQCNNIRWDI